MNIMVNENEQIVENKNPQEGFVRAGLLQMASANYVIQEACKQPDPKDLFNHLWMEGEIACLFADTGIGKSIYSVQIAAHIAETQPVLYFDCELSDKKFQMRYTNNETKEVYNFPPTLYRCSIKTRNYQDLDGFYEDRVIGCIRDLAVNYNIKIIIIDNITALCTGAEKGEDAARLMKKLQVLSEQHCWSLLIVAHTPKVKPGKAIELNDLAGSRRLPDCFDTVFCIGKCKGTANQRYIKQLKVRNGEYFYTEDSAIIYEIEKTDGKFLQFVEKGIGTEYSSRKGDGKDERIHQVLKLRKDGKEFKEIEEITGVSLKTASRWCNKYKNLSELEEGREEESEDLPEEGLPEPIYPEAPIKG